MSPHPLPASERERLVARYVAALDRGDARAVEAVVEAALHDAALDRALAEVDAAYLKEAGLPTADEADAALALVRRHLGHANSGAEGPPPLEVRAVAARLLGKGRVPPGCRAANDRLLGSDAPLPEGLGRPAITALLTGLLGAPPPAAYVEAFRREAVHLRMAHSEGPMQIAARTPRRPSH